MNRQLCRILDIADYALCRYGPLSFPTWLDFQRSNSRKLYAGKLRRGLPQYATHYGVTPFFGSSRNINHNITAPFPIPEASVDVFQSEDVFEHVALEKLLPIFDEIHRVLAPRGLFRLSLPDYHLDHHRRRCQLNSDGEIAFDPGGGGQFVDGHVTGGGHVWFPTIEIVRDLFDRSLFASRGEVRYLQYNNANGSFEMQPISYADGYIQRTPDHDRRVSQSPRPVSIVIDAFKS
jgi:SAM-dependent methyltransferase